MRFRQVHLDFHTSEAIKAIGSAFNKGQFQDMLRTGYVDSITIFSKCHHGWAYHPSEANEIHPHLAFDLLGAQIDAAHEIGVKTPVYLSAGLDQRLARKYPEWLIRDQNEKTNWTPNFMTPGYQQFCMNSPYLEILALQVHEVVTRYDADGIFLDIVGVRECYCQFCVTEIRKRGSDPRNLNDMKALWEETYFNYAARMNNTVHAVKPGLPVFHNSSHVDRGRRDLVHLNTHLELESLPTGGWGYDHFPLSARYAQTLGLDFLGMTGKFHTSWGEFGGYKHPNALRYEAALSLANGARCSIGDQLHPGGLMDHATYALIGAAYKEVAAKEEWCQDTTSVADIALLSVEAASISPGGGTIDDHSKHADIGAARILLEGHYLFDVIDTQADLGKYAVVLLPDAIVLTEPLKEKLAAFLTKGGKVLATGRSGLSADGTRFELDLGAEWQGVSSFTPSYFKPGFALPSLQNASFVLYTEGQDIALAQGGASLGSKENSYFNRDLFTFCSHQHTPSDMEDAGPGATEGPDGIYIAWNVFEDYALKGSLPVKEIVCYALDSLLANKQLRTNLPAQGITTLQAQQSHNRLVHHLLYASPVRRGQHVEVIEDLSPVLNTEVFIALSEPVREVYLAPQNTPLPFKQENGTVSYTIPLWSCHQMVVIQH
ncbi:hypothetical protein FHS16_003536 [Paenibacillus endophyticus]|uniref:Beta-galactosidase trimerisation domain-containing protein n=1 Tax=Paenibacillus endophyticus TaxID=1294268 RepID=A0A7W5GAQ0_9BACL|nr:alpha-amylase family protein [Paenibacillus endophyticus]MBB3153474.1 hypothetical protein [Paenibacillus endophyticus]